MNPALPRYTSGPSHLEALVRYAREWPAGSASLGRLELLGVLIARGLEVNGDVNLCAGREVVASRLSEEVAEIVLALANDPRVMFTDWDRRELGAVGRCAGRPRNGSPALVAARDPDVSPATTREILREIAQAEA